MSLKRHELRKIQELLHIPSPLKPFVVSGFKIYGCIDILYKTTKLFSSLYPIEVLSSVPYITITFPFPMLPDGKWMKSFLWLWYIINGIDTNPDNYAVLGIFLEPTTTDLTFEEYMHILDYIKFFGVGDTSVIAKWLRLLPLIRKTNINIISYRETIGNLIDEFGDDWPLYIPQLTRTEDKEIYASDIDVAYYMLYSPMERSGVLPLSMPFASVYTDALLEKPPLPSLRGDPGAGDAYPSVARSTALIPFGIPLEGPTKSLVSDQKQLLRGGELTMESPPSHTLSSVTSPSHTFSSATPPSHTLSPASVASVTPLTISPSRTLSSITASVTLPSIASTQSSLVFASDVSFALFNETPAYTQISTSSLRFPPLSLLIPTSSRVRLFTVTRDVAIGKRADVREVINNGGYTSAMIAKLETCRESFEHIFIPLLKHSTNKERGFSVLRVDNTWYYAGGEWGGYSPFSIIPWVTRVALPETTHDGNVFDMAFRRIKMVRSYGTIQHRRSTLFIVGRQKIPLYGNLPSIMARSPYVLSIINEPISTLSYSFPEREDTGNIGFSLSPNKERSVWDIKYSPLSGRSSPVAYSPPSERSSPAYSPPSGMTTPAYSPPQETNIFSSLPAEIQILEETDVKDMSSLLYVWEYLNGNPFVVWTGAMTEVYMYGNLFEIPMTTAFWNTYLTLLLTYSSSSPETARLVSSIPIEDRRSLLVFRNYGMENEDVHRLIRYGSNYCDRILSIVGLITTYPYDEYKEINNVRKIRKDDIVVVWDKRLKHNPIILLSKEPGSADNLIDGTRYVFLPSVVNTKDVVVVRGEGDIRHLRRERSSEY